MQSDDAAPKVVLDTNVVLDWLIFADPQVQPLVAEILSGRWRWIGTVDMQRELHEVLGRPAFVRFGHRLSAALEDAARHCVMLQPAAASTVAALRCADPDDQKFIDLAVERGAAHLFSRDKALLRLARPAAPRGVQVLRPAQWHAAGE